MKWKILPNNPKIENGQCETYLIDMEGIFGLKYTHFFSKNPNSQILGKRLQWKTRRHQIWVDLIMQVAVNTYAKFCKTICLPWPGEIDFKYLLKDVVQRWKKIYNTFLGINSMA